MRQRVAARERQRQRGAGPDSAGSQLAGLNAAADLLEGVLNATQLLALNHARLELYMAESDYARRREAFRTQFEGADPGGGTGGGAGARPAHPDARGVLIVAGGAANLANAAVALRVLRRHLNCTLPVEVVYFGPAERDAAAAALILQEAGPPSPPPLPTGSPRRGRGGPRRGGGTRALAFVTRFKEVLLLDADNVPLADPAPLFESREFRDSGSLFSPDFWRQAWADAAIYTRFGMAAAPWEGRPGFRLCDSGQLLVDRGRHYDALQWLWLLNSHTEVLYKAMHGDKDTYLLAFHLAGRAADFRQVAHWPRDGVNEVPGHAHRYHHIGMVQSDPAGLPAFLHRSSFNAKWFPHCSRRAADRAAAPGAGAAYCRPRWVTVPLSDSQAGGALKPDMYGWDAGQLDTQLYKSACAGGGGGGRGSGGRGGGDAAAKAVVPRALLAAGPAHARNGWRRRGRRRRGGGARHPRGGLQRQHAGGRLGPHPHPRLPGQAPGPAAAAALDASCAAFLEVHAALAGSGAGGGGGAGAATQA
ncbi:MAG: mannosyltransferase putative-domain-containing protein [Monoraphidium minutum]|nr:MAG: mannosyltransferase putative-domain-containing protein [Monoraphidium minutum]